MSQHGQVGPETRRGQGRDPQHTRWGLSCRVPTCVPWERGGEGSPDRSSPEQAAGQRLWHPARKSVLPLAL